MQSRLQSYLYPILTFVFPFLKDHNNCSLILLLLIVMFNILLWIYWTHNQEAPPKGTCMRDVLRNTIKSVKSFMWLHLIAYAFELVHDSFPFSASLWPVFFYLQKYYIYSSVDLTICHISTGKKLLVHFGICHLMIEIERPLREPVEFRLWYVLYHV